uniref:Large ribosomal subunit protein uL6 n=1 Tax=candidate division CPR3 bacterium TaxID=2268181 RepID=A0A7C5YS48_UNCC3
MSRIGRKPVEIPAGVEVKIDKNTITVSGPKGLLVRTFSNNVEVKIENNLIFVRRKSDIQQAFADQGLYRALIKNMIEGVTNGFERKLEMKGTGYRAEVQGNNKLILHVGFSHPVEIVAPEGIHFSVDKGTEITVSGIDKELVGNIAYKIRKVKPPEPYKGKGIRYVDEVIKKKVRKAVKGGGVEQK